MKYVIVRELPAPVQTALHAVGYRKSDVPFQVSSTVVLSAAGGSGYRGYAALVNLTTGQHTVTWGSWGGANMFNLDNAVDWDNRPYPLPADGVAITGSKGGTSPVSATVHIPASMTDRMLPGPELVLSPAERNALDCFRSYKSGQYRQTELARRGATTAVIDALVTRGLLKRNKSGATQLTTAGRNA